MLQPRDLKHLAAEADHQRGAEIGMPGIAPLRALQRFVAFATAGETAAGAVYEGNDPVDVGILRQHAGTGDGLGNEAGDGGGTVDAAEDADVVARAGFAVAATVAQERPAGLGRQQRLLARNGGEGVLARELGKGAVVGVHVGADGDGLGGKADDLAELDDRLAGGDRVAGHLVAAQDARRGGNALRR